MKKEYISPVVFQTTIHAENLMTGSITSVGGNSGVQKGEGSAPTEADGRKRDEYDEDELLDEELIQETSGWKNGLW